MFLQLNHQKLAVYKASGEFVRNCYQVTNQLPTAEKFAMVSQIRRAALSVHLNVAEGASRKSSAERKRFYQIARGSVVEIDAALDIADTLQYLKNTNIAPLGESMVQCFKILSGLINAPDKD
jgi:four helix bundle protein